MGFECQTYQVSDLIARGQLIVGDGYRAKNDELGTRGLPFARAGNINNGFRFSEADRFPIGNLARVGNKISQAGDVVFTSKGTVGRFACVRDDTQRFVYSPQLCFWRVLDRGLIEPRFLYYWMSSREFFVQFKGVAGQTDMADYVSLTDQRRMHITLPPLTQQRSIAQVLGSLDDKIDMNERMNQTFDAVARALFKSWFVDFDPVVAKAEGRDPGLPRHLADLFPDSFEVSEIGDIPKGWKVATLADFAELNPESWSKDTMPDEIEYVDLTNTKWGNIETMQRYQRWDAPSRAQRILRPGDTIIGTVRPGNGSFALISDDGLTGSTGFAVLRPRLPVYRELVYLAATRRENIERLSHLADGAAYPAVRPHVAISASIARPNHTLVERFASHTAPLMMRLSANARQSRTLGAVRDMLLPKLISGELRTKQADHEVEDGG